MWVKVSVGPTVRVRSNTVFTTHTPVPAGNESFSLELMERYFSGIASNLGLSWQQFVQQLPAEARQVLERTVNKLSWVRFLPRSKSLGRDTLRVLAAHDLLAAPPLSA